MRLWSLLTAMAFALVIVGCESKPAPAPEKKVAPAAKAPAPVAKPAAPVIALTAEGTKFDPPLAIAAVPDGAWYCDMGTVHFARSEEGDGKCGACGMALKHKAGPAAEGGHEGHTK